MLSDLFTPDDSTKLLQNRFNRTDVKFLNFDIKPISEDVEGFLGEHNNLFITYELNNKTGTLVFFIKTKPRTSAIQIEICEKCNSFKKEIFIYDFLFKEFDTLGYDISFATKCYYCIPNNTLILQNLIHEGFELSERHAMYDLNQIKCTLKALALYHAAGFAYQETKAKELGSFDLGKEHADFLEETFFVLFTNPGHISMGWWNNSFKTINTIIDLLPEEETHKLQFKKMFNSFPFGKVFVEETKLAKTCGHGDLWSNNMLFKYENCAAVECRLVDFQICRYFYPAFDVLLAIYANTTAGFRKEHLDELYRYYYNTLDDILNHYGYSIQTILPLKDFHESIRLSQTDAVLQVVCAVLLTDLPKEMVTKKMKDNDGGALQELFWDSTNLCVDAFKNNISYRKIVLETLQELKNALEASQ